MKKLLFTITILTSFISFGQAPDIEWEKNFGGSSYDHVKSIQQTVDGGYIAVGFSSSNNGDVGGNHGGYDYWVVKLDATGNISWEKNYGGAHNDLAYSIQQTTDGGYVVVGNSLSNNEDVGGNNGNNDYWVVKLDALGNITWEKNLGGSENDFANSIQQTTDGGYIVVGSSDSNDGDVGGNNGLRDCWIVKLDATGNISWEENLGGSENDYAMFVQQTTDEGYIVAATSSSSNGDVNENFGGGDYWVVKLDATGNITWEKNYGGSSHDSTRFIQRTTDQGYIVVGSSESNNGDVGDNYGYTDYWIIKLDIEGDIIWGENFGGSNYDYAYSIQQTNDGGYIVAGSSNSNDGDVAVNLGSDDFWIMKLDVSGNIVWSKSLGGTGTDQAYSIKQTIDGGYIIAGLSASNDGDVSANYGIYDYWIVKLAPDNTASVAELDKKQVTTYPNPVKDNLTIAVQNTPIQSISIVDVTGKLVKRFTENTNTINVGELVNGVYFITVNTDKGVYQSKFVKE